MRYILRRKKRKRIASVNRKVRTYSMMPTSILVANRGEIAIRVMRAAAELGVRAIAVFSEDDSHSLHLRRADEARPLRGRGATAYLDLAQIIATAKAAGCDAIHPGYGFLSESAAFASRCIDEGIAFIGPRPETLALFGDKLARATWLAGAASRFCRGPAGRRVSRRRANSCDRWARAGRSWSRQSRVAAGADEGRH